MPHKKAKQMILINGAMRSGKDFTASLLAEELNLLGLSTELVSFAYPMKYIISQTFDISLEQLDDYKNNLMSLASEEQEVITNFRQILQRFGTEGMKPVFGDDVWAVMGWQKAINSRADVIIITDYRFDIEGQTFVRNAKDLVDVFIDFIYIKGQASAGDNHSSEVKPSLEFNYEVDNSKQDDTVKQFVKFYAKVCNDRR